MTLKETKAATLPAGRRQFVKHCAGGIAAAILTRPAHAQVPQLAALVSKNMQGKCVGIAVAVSDKYGNDAAASWGTARRHGDPPYRPMHSTLKFDVASVSKTITAAAMLRLLWTTPNVHLDSPFVPFLPAHWNRHWSLNAVTFRQLLSHRSGLPGDHNNVGYGSSKNYVQAGATLPIGEYKYSNTNYALMRLLIPRIAGYQIHPMFPGASGDLLKFIEQTQAQQMADGYIDYVRKTVWSKIPSATNMSCKSSDTNPNLCYRFPDTSVKGTYFGDRTLVCASQGWHVSATQLRDFMDTLHRSAAILPEWLSNAMLHDELGYRPYATPGGKAYSAKSGLYPATADSGELNSLIAVFSNGVHVSAIVNSQMTKNVKTTVAAAFDEVYG